MSVKAILKKIIPSFRAEEALHREISGLQDKIDILQRNMDSMKENSPALDSYLFVNCNSKLQ